MGRPTCKSSQSRSTRRRGSHEDRVANMKPHAIQFDVRENTASARQHASRFAARSNCDQSTSPSPTLQGDVPLARAVSHESGATSQNHAANSAATVEEGKTEHQLLTVREVADMLQVPASWVYGRMRKRSTARLPAYRIGKYWRFSEDEILAWVKHQRGDQHAA
jgi:excisionase family DNA binding protein